MLAAFESPGIGLHGATLSMLCDSWHIIVILTVIVVEVCDCPHCKPKPTSLIHDVEPGNEYPQSHHNYATFERQP